MLTHNYLKIIVLLLLTGACNPENSGTSDTNDTDAGSTGGASSTTGEMSTTGSTSPAEGTTGDTMTTEEPEATTTEGDTTGGGLDPSVSCEAYCEHAVECGLESDAAECVALCIAEFEELLEELMGQCVVENEALLNCAAALSCQELSGELESGPCSDELAAFLSCAGIEPESGALP